MNEYYEFSPKLNMWYHEALRESMGWRYHWERLKGLEINENFAIYPKRYYHKVAKMSHTKVVDYCFIGGLNTDKITRSNRQWLLDFVENNFTNESYLQFTDKDTLRDYRAMGFFDYSNNVKGFVPKEHPVRKRNTFDENYFSKLCQSKFSLCPGGDRPWSMRFYESLMCKSIPIVSNHYETFRSKSESELEYKYYLSTDKLEYRQDWVEHNYEIFLKYHTFAYTTF